MFRWVVYYKRQNRWQYRILDYRQKEIMLPLYRFLNKESDSEPSSPMDRIPVTHVAVTAVDRLGNESPVKVKNIDVPLSLP